MIPGAWRRYTIPAGLTVIQWITDFSLRIKQLQTVGEASMSGGTSALKVHHAHQLYTSGQTLITSKCFLL